MRRGLETALAVLRDIEAAGRRRRHGRQHGDRGAARRRRGAAAQGKPRRPLPRRLSRADPGARQAQHRHARRPRPISRRAARKAAERKRLDCRAASVSSAAVDVAPFAASHRQGRERGAWPRIWAPPATSRRTPPSPRTARASALFVDPQARRHRRPRRGEGGLPCARRERRLRGRLCATAMPSPANATVARVAGSARALLSAERVALNFLCRMSGIATLTRTLRGRGARHPRAHRRHAQDDAAPARLREIRRALRRRRQSPHRPLRRDPDQGQPHRRRGRHHARRSRPRARAPVTW